MGISTQYRAPRGGDRCLAWGVSPRNKKGAPKGSNSKLSAAALRKQQERDDQRVDHQRLDERQTDDHGDPDRSHRARVTTNCLDRRGKAFALTERTEGRGKTECSWAMAGAAKASATKITAKTANRRVMLILPKVGIP